MVDIFIVDRLIGTVGFDSVRHVAVCLQAIGGIDSEDWFRLPKNLQLFPHRKLIVTAVDDAVISLSCLFSPVFDYDVLLG